MIDELHVRDVALVEDATLAFSPAFTVLTGETGAGKTALLAALRLVTGQRADSHLVRDGAAEALAEARLLQGGCEHVVSRRLSAQGRSRCSIDGEMATVAALAASTGGVRMHNQHEQVQLLQPATQLDYLDAWSSEVVEALATYRSAWNAYRQAAKLCAELERACDAQAQELDYLRFVKAQIDEVNPQEGEYEALEADLPRLQHAEQLAQALAEVQAHLGADGAAADLMAQAAHVLQRQRGIDTQLDGLAERLDEVQAQLDDLLRDLRAYGQTVVYDPQALHDTLARLEALAGLMRRYGPGMEQVLELQNRATAQLAAAEASPEQLEEVRAARACAERDLRCAAAELSAERERAAAGLCARLQASVAELAMPNAEFEFRFEELDFERWEERGSARAELWYRPASGAQAHPLARIASGGELSRILLALECTRLEAAGAAVGSTGRDDALTLVFDEVDQGIGGATGAAVACRLQQLAEHAQVIVVTHLPQVAALADTHLVVAKQEKDGVPSTIVTQVDGEERVAEVARMLAGRDDATALDHARTLLEGRL